MSGHTSQPGTTVLVLTGGRSTRFGQDKATTPVAGTRMLDHILAAIPETVPVIVVGADPGATPRRVTVTREDPPGGGPVAGILAGVRLVSTELTCVVATDMPLAAALALELAAEHHSRLAANAAQGSRKAPDAPDALIPVDADGHPQPLCASYTTGGLRAAGAALGSGHNAAVRHLLRHLDVSEVPLDESGQLRLFDIDTRQDLIRTQGAIMSLVDADSDPRTGGRSAGTGGSEVLTDWAAAAAKELDLDTEVPVDLILDVAKEAAHGVARPAAPLTTFLLGYAAASGADPDEAAAKLNALAARWPGSQD